MPFVDLKLADVELEKPSPLPVGSYVFLLRPGAAYRINKFNGMEELNISASVAEGEFAGRVVFWSYPDPTVQSKTGKSMAWSAQAMKKLEIAIGNDSLPGEDPQMYFNRIALNGLPRFGADMVAETRKNAESGEYEAFTREGESGPRSVFSIFSVRPAA